ncbi:choice-of-anchor L domain-containing protein [Flavobacterium sp.]|uniref:DUF7619 domain-containing protein n=1 Tax=Flavobacterium sp. TaxID=239 RepID=UPI0026212A9B|nr:choice-of-anchor L domain-containing protein [Flavobacterium sp.]
MKKQLLLTLFCMFFVGTFLSTAQTSGCSQFFYDNGGQTGNYTDSAYETTTFCPNTTNETMLISFNSISLDNFDSLYVYEGTAQNGTLLAAINSNSPSQITFSTNTPGSCVTFVFESDSAGNSAGWEAVIDCVNNTPQCLAPISLNVVTLNATSAVLFWTDINPSTGPWEIVLTANGTSTGTTFIVSSNPFDLVGLTPGIIYNASVRTTCGNVFSDWSAPFSFSTVQNAPCNEPTNLTASSLTSTSAQLNWNDPSGTQWEINVSACGTPANSNVFVTSNSYLATNLTASTCYNVFIRSICANAFSPWSQAYTFTTPANPNPAPVCGGQFIDNGGLTANYANLSDNTYTICPTNPGDQVVVTFSSFNTEANWDGLYVFNGNTISSPQISSGNPAGSVPGGLAGAFWGTTIPGPFVSSAANGCLTFRFRSDSSVNKEGWVASVACSPQATCLQPSIMPVNNISGTSANINWQENGTATQWEVIVVPAAASAPTQTSVGVVTSTNPFQATGLNYSTSYKAYVRAICSANDKSYWSYATTFTTLQTNCFTPSSVLVNSTTATTANLSWNQSGTVSQWEVLVLPSGSPAPTAASIGVLTASNSFQATGLNTGTTYTFYVRAVCSTTENSNWSTVLTFTPTQTVPAIAVSTSQYTVDQLVNNVLINNPCLTVSNITSSTGTNFGSVNGIGSFTNTNPLFPISSGIVLSSGSAMSAPGPNTTILSQGSSTWTGDTQLEGIISSAIGVPMVSKNATKLEFDFTSLNSFMSFNFLLASDEYGTFQCDFADAFAFLLTDLDTGITTNLAVIPGTTTPVSVVTIRNSLHNNSCASANPLFFDSFYGTNQTGSATNYNGQTVKMTASANIIPNRNYHIKLVIADRSDTAYDSSVFIEAGTFASGPPQCSDKIELVAFIDENGNGIKETTEVNFTYGSFTSLQNNAGNVTNISSPAGTYTVYDANPSNVYDFGYAIDTEYAPYYTLGPINYNDINIPLNSGTQTLYFPITLTQGFNDVSVSIVPLGTPVPGFNYNNKIVYKNLGIVATDGTLTFNKDANVSITNISQLGTIANANGFSYNFTNLAPYETRYIYVTMSVPTIPTVNLGDLLTNSTSILATANDINLSNNNYSNTQIVVGAYDPNDKMEAHGEEIPFNQFAQNDYLYYTIRFQNEGTANAINIRIEDFLDAQLEESSIRMVDASHNYIMERIGNHISWKFDFIHLPSYLENIDLSKGYVTFKIRLKPGFAVGDLVPNTASIYFDTNPAIVTNTFTTEFTAALANANFGLENFVLYPNPTNSFVQVNLQNTSEILENIIIYDVLGKTVSKLSTNNSNEMKVDVSSLSKGIYLVEITTQSDLKITKKLVIN